MTGSLMSSMVETRPDIAYSIAVAARFAKNPSRAHTEAVKNILHYLKGSLDRGITYGGKGDWSADALLSDAAAREGKAVFRLNPADIEAILLKGDNQGSIALAHTPVFHSRTKHIHIQHH